MDDDIAEQVARRDAFRKRTIAKESYSERMRKMAELQEATWKVLKANPAAWAHFIQRNFKKRAIDFPPPDATRLPDT